MSLMNSFCQASFCQTFRPFSLLAFAVACHTANAQALPMPENVVQLSASAQAEVVQDWLNVELTVRHQAADAGTVQNHLKLTLDRALAQIRSQLGAGLQVSSGAFSVQPRYGRDGQISGWQGNAELLLQGQDVAKVASTAGTVPGMVVSQLYFSVSPQTRQREEADVRREAIAQFKAQALQVAQDFGFKGYQLLEVSIGEAGLPPTLRPRVMLAAEPGATISAAPVPTEPGKSMVRVTVSGSVQLR